jgi:transmembrane sensor
MAGTNIGEFGETRRLAEASAWRVALFEADLESTEDFEAWLAADHGNPRAWRQVCGSWDRLDRDAMEPELIIARRDVLERVRRQKARRFAGASRWRSSAMRIAAVLVVTAIVGLLIGLSVWQSTTPEVYQTALGERRTITLADGSHVSLDANSRLTVKLLRKARMLELVRGQAHFDVAHDVSRPFTVRARDKTVVATGTSFNVDLLGAEVIVTLLEGRVSVLQERPAGFTLAGAQSSQRVVLAKLTPGEQLIAPLPRLDQSVVPTTPLMVERVSLDQATAWEAGQLVFDNEPLSSVVRRVSRYTSQPLVADQGVASLRLSGVFDAGDLKAFVDAVQRALPVVAETHEDGAIYLRRRPV